MVRRSMCGSAVTSRGRSSWSSSGPNVRGTSPIPTGCGRSGPVRNVAHMQGLLPFVAKRRIRRRGLSRRRSRVRVPSLPLKKCLEIWHFLYLMTELARAGNGRGQRSRGNAPTSCGAVVARSADLQPLTRWPAKSASPLQFKKRGFDVRATSPTGPAPTPDPVAAWMAVAGSGVSPRQATVEPRPRRASCRSFRLPTSGTRPANSPSENHLPASRLQLSVEQRRTGPGRRAATSGRCCHTTDVPPVIPVAASAQTMANVRSAQSSPGRCYRSAANTLAGASRARGANAIRACDESPESPDLRGGRPGGDGADGSLECKAAVWNGRCAPPAQASSGRAAIPAPLDGSRQPRVRFHHPERPAAARVGSSRIEPDRRYDAPRQSWRVTLARTHHRRPRSVPFS